MRENTSTRGRQAKNENEIGDRKENTKREKRDEKHQMQAQRKSGGQNCIDLV
jgi:hypothetical protein